MGDVEKQIQAMKESTVDGGGMTWIRLIDVGDGAGSSLVAEGSDGGYSERLKCDVDKTCRC